MLFPFQTRVHFIGSLSGYPQQFLTTSGMLFEVSDSESLLYDCPENALQLLRDMGAKIENIKLIVISHMHADHTCGLVALLDYMRSQDLFADLQIIGPEGLLEYVESIFELAGYDTTQLGAVIHEIKFDFEHICLGEPGAGTQLQKVQVERFNLLISAFPIKHAVPAIGYLFKFPRQTLLVIFDFDAAKTAVPKLAHEGDDKRCTLFCECTFSDECYTRLDENYGHSCPQLIREFIKRFNAEQELQISRVVLNHFSARWGCAKQFPEP